MGQHEASRSQRWPRGGTATLPGRIGGEAELDNPGEVQANYWCWDEGSHAPSGATACTGIVNVNQVNAVQDELSKECWLNK